MNAVGILGVELDVDRIDVGEALEQHRLAFHHRLGGERAEIAEAEDRGAVGDDRDEIALGGIVIGLARILGDGARPARRRRANKRG